MDTKSCCRLPLLGGRPQCHVFSLLASIAGAGRGHTGTGPQKCVAWSLMSIPPQQKVSACCVHWHTCGIIHLYSTNMVDDSTTNYLQDIIDHIQDASHQHPNLPVQSHPRLLTDKNITIFQQTATDYTSNVSYDVGKIFQSQLAFSVELTAI